jgi:HEAT repeat protein
MHVIPDHFSESLLRQFGNIPDRLLRILFRRGGEFQRVHVIRRVGARREQNWRSALRDGLKDQSPAIRRNSASALGSIGSRLDAQQLIERAETERCDTVRFHLVLSAVRCGIESSRAWAVLDAAANRRIRCAYGERSTGSISGWSKVSLEGFWASSGASGSLQQGSAAPALSRARTAIQGNTDDREAVLAIGLWANQQDAELIESLWSTAGRRMRLILCRAMGLNGDPRFYRRLVACLESVDVDPGHGFALRSEASIALGRLGLARAVKPLVRALETEALEHEGRPGAGMGIQRSVRTHVLAALGELQAAPDVLRGYLGNTHGSAQGGFYLPAMDALWKHGNGAGLRELMSHTDLVAANALGVLHAIEGDSALNEWKNDKRPMIAAVVVP